MSSENPPRARPLRLAAFLRQERAPILREWEGEDRGAGLPSTDMSQEEFLNHIPVLLDDMAHLADKAMGGDHEADLPRATPRLHAWHRLQHDFSLEQVVREYATLRKVLLRKLAPRMGELDAGEWLLLNASLDQAVTEAVVAYADGSRQRLEEERQRLEAVLEFLPTAVLIARAPEGALVFGNRQVAQVLGHAFLPTEDVAGYGEYRAYHLDHRRYAPAEYPLARALTGEQVVREEMYYQQDSGAWSYLHVSATPLRDARGRITAAVLSMVDLTEMKQLEDEQRVLANETRQRADFERQLIGIVSHDLRNPLSAITLGAATLLRRTDIDTRQRSSVTRMLNSAERAHRMIRDLLDFTQARLGGGIPVSPRPMNAHELLRQVVDEVRLAHPDHSFEVQLQGDGQGVWDGDRLAQVLTNLLTNAVHHSPADAPVIVRSLTGDERVRLEVHNLGPPLPEELRARLFLPMERGKGEEGTDRSGRSVGLGLYIVKSIVTAHGGHVEAHSAEGAGTTFVVDLPKRSAPRDS